MSPPAFFVAEHITKLQEDGRPLFEDVSFQLERGEAVVISGRSGSGKTTLLKCLSELTPYDAGGSHFCGLSPSDLTPPVYRTHVLYVPQRPALLPGTPLDFWNRITSFNAWQSDKASAATEATAHLPTRAPANGSVPAVSGDEDESRWPPIEADPIQIAKGWDLPEEAWNREWMQLSGGEAQRAGLAISVALIGGKRKGNGVLLLDEPTSALDPSTVHLVEKTLLGTAAAPTAALVDASTEPESGSARPIKKKAGGGAGPLTLVWITHSDEQAERIKASPGGGKLVYLGGQQQRKGGPSSSSSD